MIINMIKVGLKIYFGLAVFGLFILAVAALEGMSSARQIYFLAVAFALATAAVPVVYAIRLLFSRLSDEFQQVLKKEPVVKAFDIFNFTTRTVTAIAGSNLFAALMYGVVMALSTEGHVERWTVEKSHVFLGILYFAASVPGSYYFARHFKWSSPVFVLVQAVFLVGVAFVLAGAQLFTQFAAAGGVIWWVTTLAQRASAQRDYYTPKA